MEALPISTAVIFVASSASKSALMATIFAARYRARDVLIGTHCRHAQGPPGLGGDRPLDRRRVRRQPGHHQHRRRHRLPRLRAGTLRGDEPTEDEAEKARRSEGAAILAVGVAFFLAELGDKTMLATITLATHEGWFGTWIGSTSAWSPPTPSPS